MRDPSLDALVPAIADRMPGLLAEIREALRPDWPDYADFLAEHEVEVSVSADVVVHRLVALATGDGGDGAGDAGDDAGVERELFESIGRLQWREGHDLTDLLSAYRTGVRVFWRQASAIALEVGVAPDTLAALAEAVFFFVDRLSSSSARGFVLEQGEAGALRERHRDELVALLLSDRADAAAVEAAALRAGWRLPQEVAVVLLADGVGGDPGDPRHDVLARFDSSFLPIRRPTLPGVIVPDPSAPGRRETLRTRLRGTGAVVGAAVRPEDLPASLRIAEITARLREEGVLGGDPVFAIDHLDAIIVHRDGRLYEALCAQVLAPLQDSPAASRDRLRETLASWLRHMGDRQAMAAELHVHPQTVRYRLGRLHDLFGPALDDPETRARLTLALAWA